MPRGTCENCGRHDVFVYAVPLACGLNAFVCTRCLKLPEARLEDDEDEEDVDWELPPMGRVARRCRPRGVLALLTITSDTHGADQVRHSRLERPGIAGKRSGRRCERITKAVIEQLNFQNDGNL